MAALKIVCDSESMPNHAPTNLPDGNHDDLEKAKFLFEMWKFRQGHCWKSLHTFMFAAVAVSIVPYIMDKTKAEHLGKMLYGFPILGWLIALAAAWHFAAEYVRCQLVHDELKKIARRLSMFTEIPKTWFDYPKIGWVTVGCIGIGYSILSVLNCIGVRFAVLSGN